MLDPKNGALCEYREAMSDRTYAQYCAVATALDAIGDRWALLVIRELLSGPKRYTDLRDGLPGISTDVLAARLRDLEVEGVVERRVLRPPAASRVYQLTEEGAALEPVMTALARWGIQRLSPVQQGEFRLHWLEISLRSLLRPDTGVNVTVDFVVDGGRLRACIRDGVLEVDQDASGAAEVVIDGDAGAIALLARGGASRAAVLADGRVVIGGDPAAVAALQRAFGRESPG